MPRIYTRLAGVMLIVAAIAAGAFHWLRPPARPNLLLITLDTVRADHLGSYGGRIASTPTLDRIARDGVRFERAYSPTPLTLPAHASLLTGLQPPTHGLTDNGMRAQRFPVPTLAERLQAEGYDTAAFVAAFVLNSIHGLDRGFARYDDGPDEAGDVFELFRGTAPAAERVDRLLEWLRQPRQQPFFAWLHLFDAHSPYLPPPGFETRYAANPYDGEIAYIDSQLARVLAFLEREALVDNTVVVVTADHGEGLGEHGEVTHGVFLYDATLRVPLLVHWRGRLAARVETAPAALVDLLPTLLGLLDMPPQARAHGIDLFDSEPRPAPWRFFALSEYPRRQYGWSRLAALREGAMKYIDAPRPELYDGAADPHERSNLIERRSDSTAVRLKDALSVAERELRAQGDVNAIDAQLTPQQQQRLQSLGYLASREIDREPDRTQVDPKDGLRSLGPIEIAFEALARGELAEAERLFGESFAAAPRSLSAREGMARTLELAGRELEAERWHESVLEIDPQSMLSLARLIDIRTRRGDCQAAEGPAIVLRRLLPDAAALDARLSRCAGPRRTTSAPPR
jgi:choline-sulfatase